MIRISCGPLRFRWSYLLLLMLKPGLPLRSPLAAWLWIVSGLLHLEGDEMRLVISMLVVEFILVITIKEIVLVICLPSILIVNWLLLN